MNIRKAEDARQEIITHFQQRLILPILGAGVSRHEKCKDGIVPDAEDFCKYMKEQIYQIHGDDPEIENMKFREICDIYETDEQIDQRARRNYIRKKFKDVELPELKKQFLNLPWPYIYTLNIDDAIENNSNYNNVIGPGKQVSEEIFEESKCVIKLHGDVNEMLKYSDAFKVFTSKEYTQSITSNKMLLKKLEHDYINTNIVFVGCSLCDEIDLMSIGIANDMPNPIQNRKIYFCYVGTKIDYKVRLRLQRNNVTDILLFENFDKIYEFFVDIGNEVERLQGQKIDQFGILKICNLSPQDQQNKEFFFNGLSPYSHDEIIKPSYIVERDLLMDIIRNFKRNNIHIITGNLISGKTYLLINLYEKIVDRARYIFGSDTQINNASFDKLLNLKNSVIILDSDVLTREQFEKLLDNAELIKNNLLNFVICINKNDGDKIGLINLKRKKNEIFENDVNFYSLADKMNERELSDLNHKLPGCKLPLFKKGCTNIDNLLLAEHNLNYKGRFSAKTAKISTQIKDLVCYIVLATKNKLYSDTCIKLDISKNMEALERANRPFIQQEFAQLFERNGSNAPYKYVLNSKFWLVKSLGEYVKSTTYQSVVEAYQYIVERLDENVNGNKDELQKNCKDFILFDTINSIFYTKSGGKLHLIKKIYDGLYRYLNENYQYMHQFAKCCLKLGISARQSEIRNINLDNANKYAQIALSQVEDRYAQTSNEKLLITIAHINFTIATIYCERYDPSVIDTEQLTMILDKVKDAIFSNYNFDAMNDDSTSGAIKIFLKKLLNNRLVFQNKKLKNDVQEILNFIRQQ